MRFLFFVFRRFPLSLLRLFFRLLMSLVYLVVPSRRRIAQRNISKALNLDSKSSKRLAFKTYMYFADMIAINVKHLGDERFIRKRVTVEGYEHFQRAKAMKKGVIFTTAHYGNWELMVCAFAILKEPINVMVRPMDNAKLDRLINEIRSACGNRIISSRESAFGFIRMLKRNGVLGVLVDQAGGDGTFKVEFFSMPAKVSESIALFSYKLGTPILPAYMEEDAGGFRVIIESPIVAEHTGNFQQDIATTMKKVYSRFEKWIRKHPERYLWMHNRWKR